MKRFGILTIVLTALLAFAPVASANDNSNWSLNNCDSPASKWAGIQFFDNDTYGGDDRVACIDVGVWAVYDEDMGGAAWSNYYDIGYFHNRAESIKVKYVTGGATCSITLEGFDGKDYNLGPDGWGGSFSKYEVVSGTGVLSYQISDGKDNEMSSFYIIMTC